VSSGNASTSCRAPACRGVVGDVEVDEFAAVVAEHEEDEQQAERQGRREEEVDGHEVSGRRPLPRIRQPGPEQSSKDRWQGSLPLPRSD
jgi:hypothetical protein